MLVLTRRENDRIDFPALGITIEVVRLTRSRATLAIDAPRHIRIVRHEIGSDASPSREGLPRAIRREVMSNIQDEINAATKKLKIAQQDLSDGRTDDALLALGEALAELDALRYGAAGLEADDCTVAGGVAEASVGYANSATDDVADQCATIVFVDATDHGLAADLAEAGFAIFPTPEALTVVFRQQPADWPNRPFSPHVLVNASSSPD